MSVSILSGTDKKENNLSTRHSLKSIKNRSHRILKATSPNSVIFDDRQITDQLMHQFALINKAIEEYSQKRSIYDTVRKTQSIMLKVIAMEQVLQGKDEDIKKINEQIKNLKTAKYKMEEDEKQQNPLFEDQIFMLAEELKRQRFQLNNLIVLHSNSLTRWGKVRTAIKKLESSYVRKFGDRAISYQQFKEKNEVSRREEEMRKRKGTKDCRVVSIRQKHETSSDHAFPKSQGGSKCMKDLQNKKSIAESAFKNGRKKHITELAELNAKLQFLRDEDMLLNQKITEIQTQKEMLQIKFDHKIKNRIRDRHFGQLSPSSQIRNYDLRA